MVPCEALSVPNCTLLGADRIDYKEDTKLAASLDEAASWVDKRNTSRIENMRDMQELAQRQEVRAALELPPQRRAWSCDCGCMRLRLQTAPRLQLHLFSVALGSRAHHGYGFDSWQGWG